ncbi:MAG TPA: adenosylcobinamide-phosphate synthase CbiB [Stellaceae bacterium]|nr:adenosylcobinamide-phosphate synthase CbiB [Stellaceae bacterium]
MTLPGLHDPLLLLYLGMIADALFGEMGALFRTVPHPVVLAGRAIGWCERRLNRPRRSPAARRARGVLTVVVLIALAAGCGWVLQRLCRSGLPGAAIEAFAVAVLLAQRSLFDHVAAVASGLLYEGLAAGRAAVSHIVGRDPYSLDGPGVARAAIESLAENFSDGVVAPALWYLALGLPGLFAYKMANTLDSMIGHKNERYRAFGWAAARLDDLLNLLPAPISGLLIAAAAAFDRETRAGGALRIMLRDGRKHHSPNAGWPEAAMAGALGLMLAGPRHYAGEVVMDPFLGDGTPIAAVTDINRALRLYFRACLILGGLTIGAWTARHFIPPW